MKNNKKTEEWQDYDAAGHIIHYKDSNGYEIWRDRDANSNKVH